MISACVLVIGNEILSGRTKDANFLWLAEQLNAMGIALREGRFIADDEATIVQAVNACRRTYDYVFTTGGIGPTHDDITADAIAAALDVPLERHPEAERVLEAHYGRAQLNAARLKMADIPRGAALIANPVSAAPGFFIENVYVFAGVPSIMRAMFDGIRGRLQGGPPMLSRTVNVSATEGMFATDLAGIQTNHPEVEIGSYPFIRHGKLGASIVVRCTDEAKLAEAECDVLRLFRSMNALMEE